METDASRKNRPLTNVVGLAVVFLLFPLGVAFMAVWIVATLALHLTLLLAWLPRGRRVLFVTSDSPRWKPYLDAHVVPRLPPNAVVLDWSERARWSRLDLGVWLFHIWSGARDYNPVAIVVRAGGSPRIYRFFEPFSALAHGDDGPVRAVQAALFADLGGE